MPLEIKNVSDIKIDLKDIYYSIVKFNNEYEIIDFDKIIKKDTTEVILYNDSDIDCDFLYTDHFSYVVVDGDKIVGFLIYDERFSYCSDIILSADADWIDTMKKIIIYCADAGEMNDYLEISTDNRIITKICEDYFNGYIVPDPKKIRMESKLKRIIIPMIDYTQFKFPDSNKINIDFFKSPERIEKIFSLNGYFSVIKFEQKEKDCKCKSEKYAILFDKPLYLNRNYTDKSDLFVNIKLTIANVEYVITDQYMDEMGVDKFYRLRFNKFSDIYSAIESNEYIIYGIYISDPEKIIKYGYGYGYREKQEICGVCRKDGWTNQMYVSSERRLLSVFIFNKLDISDDVIDATYKNIPHINNSAKKLNLNKLFNTKQIFVPDKLIYKTKKEDKNMFSSGEYCYINREREAIRMKENIFKIGRTKQDGDERLKQYPKGTVQMIKKLVSDCVACEREIIKVFNEKFKKKPEFGNEYYEGNYEDMEEEFLTITNKYK